MKPLIGITAARHLDGPRDWHYNNTTYFRAVEIAGGIPVLLPFCETADQAAAILDRIDGLLLSGGVDIDPLRFGEDPHPKNGEISPERDATETALIQAALERDMPVLGICRGHQMLAVATGGALWQDIPAQVPGAMKHSQQAPRWYPTHTVSVVPGSRLAGLLGTEVKVNTYHHQAVKRAATDWVVSAQSSDGIIEAMEMPSRRFVLAVQWHPETFAGLEFNHDALFRAFVDAAGAAPVKNWAGGAQASVEVRPAAGQADRDWLAELWRTEWGGETMVTRGRTHHLSQMEALIAWSGDRRVGAATLRVEKGDCELMSLNALESGNGVGTRLLEAAEVAARAAGCSRLWLITANDNLEALRFYQRRGYRLAAVYPGAVDEARRLKRSIPVVGEHGIPIHDDLELAKNLS